MILVVYGIPRSGSTWLFNTVRLCLERKKIPFISGFSKPSDALGKGLVPDANRLLVLKSHDLGDTNLLHKLVESDEARVMLSSRETITQLASGHRVTNSNSPVGSDTMKRKILSHLKRTEQDLEDLGELSPFAVVQESKMRHQTSSSIREVARFLNLKFNRREIKEMTEQLTLEAVENKISEMRLIREWKGEFKEYDRNTHWHANHIAETKSTDLFTPDLITFDGYKKIEAVRKKIANKASKYSQIDLNQRINPTSKLEVNYLSSSQSQQSNQQLPLNLESQKGQVRFVLENAFNYSENGLARERYFIDLAAGHPITHSNTWFLETFLGWKGLLIEPNSRYAELLRKERKSGVVESVIASEDNKNVEFRVDNGMLGGIVGEDFDNTPIKIKNSTSKLELLELQTRTLESVLEEQNAPKEIDYLSLDVEGAEWECMKNFPFNRYRFRAMTIERLTLDLALLLDSHGYIQMLHTKHDTFLIHRDFIESANKQGLNPKFWIGPPKSKI